MPTLHLGESLIGKQMNKILPFVFLLIFVSSLISQDTITLAIGEWQPFTSEIEENSKMLEILVREAFAIEGVNVIYEYYPWKRSYMYTEQGMVDGTFPWIKTDEREVKFIYHEEPLIIEETLLFHLETLDFHWDDFNDLEDYLIGGTIGYADTQLLESFGLTVEAERNEYLNFQKLVLGRIDIYPAAKSIAFHLLNKSFDETEKGSLTYHPKPLYEVEYYVLFSKARSKAQYYSDLLDSGLRYLKRIGRYDEILSSID